ncbi:SDR family NAD(P)-dependent oxidoreductase [Actinomadura sp. 9N215]|uniref:SDR family NAD(P)-dependent oxidoreductase n=1 Tax=Actinomadura sp. 9N215 TaxID=3375150 RepID=UPI003795B89A
MTGRTAVVVGAGRGLGRGIAGAFAEADASVIAVARTGDDRTELAGTNENIQPERGRSRGRSGGSRCSIGTTRTFSYSTPADTETPRSPAHPFVLVPLDARKPYRNSVSAVVRAAANRPFRRGSIPLRGALCSPRPLRRKD